MSVSFEDFLQSAEVLLSNPNSKEIDFRNLISRSYYALFHLGEEKSKNLPVQRKKDGEKPKGSHEKVIIKFEQHPDENLKQIGREMNRLKQTRCLADYKIRKHIVRSKAEKHLFDVKNVIKQLQQLNTH